MRTGTRRRAIPLPRKLAPLSLVGAKLDAGLLVVRLAAAAGRRALMRVVLLTGKGGVGKTTLSAATALGAAEHGHRVFLLSTDPAHSVGDALGRPVGARPVEVAPNVVAQEVAVLDETRSLVVGDPGLAARSSCARAPTSCVAEELLVFPGLEELVALRAVREVEALGDFDVCVVDCAPTGSTLRMLRFPDALRVFMGSFFDWSAARRARCGRSSTRIGMPRPGAGRRGLRRRRAPLCATSTTCARSCSTAIARARAWS